MIKMKFITLCTNIGLDAEYADASHLHTLEQWCDENVSQDLRFHGGKTEQYQNYMELARIYLDEFCPKLPRELDTCVTEFDGRNTIQEAAYSGLDRLLSSLAPTGDILNKANSKSMTPLHIAAISGHFHTISVLLSLGADAAIANKHQQLPIFSALILPVIYEDELKENKIKIFRLLKDKAPETVKLQDKNNDTVLLLMAIHGFSTLMSELLQTNGALAFITNNHTHYPIHTAILNNQAESALLLLQQKDVAILKDSKGWVALHYAAHYSGRDMVALCCDFTTDLNLQDCMGKTPLLLAAEAANIDAMDTLVQRGARVDLTDAEGRTALHLAVKSEDVAAVSWLLDHTTIDVNAHDTQHQTPLSLCAESVHAQIGDLLLARGAIAT